MSDIWDDGNKRCSTSPISGQAGVAGGSGVVSALTQRVCLATDAALPAGTNVLGHVIVDSGSTAPTDPSATTGTITALDAGSTSITNAINQTTVTGTPTAGAAVQATLSADNSIVVQLSGTFAGTVAFERSIDGGITWVSFSLEQLSVGATASSLALSDNKAYLLRGNVGAMTAVRVRCTAYTSGTLSVRLQPAYGISQVIVNQGPPNSTANAWPVDTELPAAAALADGASATPTTPTVGSIGLVMNATTMDVQRAVVNSLNTVGTGITAAGLVAQLDDTSTSSVTENQFAAVRMSSRRVLYVEGPTAAGSAVAANPVVVGGSDGTNVRAVASDTSGNQTAVGNVANAVADSGAPVKIGGKSFAAAGPGGVTAGQRTDGWYTTFGQKVVCLTYNSSQSQTDGTKILGTLDSGGSVSVLAVGKFAYNGTTADKWRNNISATVLASSAQTATQNSADQVNYNGRRLAIVVNVSVAGSGSITPTLQIKDSISGNYKTIWTAAVALTGNGPTIYYFADGAPNTQPAASSLTEALPYGLMGRTWRVAVTANNANSITYSVSGEVGV